MVNVGPFHFYILLPVKQARRPEKKKKLPGSGITLTLFQWESVLSQETSL